MNNHVLRINTDPQAHIVSFLRDAATHNMNDFTAIVGQLKPEEIMVVQKVVS